MLDQYLVDSTATRGAGVATMILHNSNVVVVVSVDSEPDRHHDRTDLEKLYVEFNFIQLCLLTQLLIYCIQ